MYDFTLYTQAYTKKEEVQIEADLISNYQGSTDYW